MIKSGSFGQAAKESEKCRSYFLYELQNAYPSLYAGIQQKIIKDVPTHNSGVQNDAINMNSGKTTEAQQAHHARQQAYMLANQSRYNAPIPNTLQMQRMQAEHRYQIECQQNQVHQQVAQAQAYQVQAHAAAHMVMPFDHQAALQARVLGQPIPPAYISPEGLASHQVAGQLAGIGGNRSHGQLSPHFGAISPHSQIYRASSPGQPPSQQSFFSQQQNVHPKAPRPSARQQPLQTASNATLPYTPSPIPSPAISNQSHNTGISQPPTPAENLGNSTESENQPETPQQTKLPTGRCVSVLSSTGSEDQVNISLPQSPVGSIEPKNVSEHTSKEKQQEIVETPEQKLKRERSNRLDSILKRLEREDIREKQRLLEKEAKMKENYDSLFKWCASESDCLKGSIIGNIG